MAVTSWCDSSDDSSRSVVNSCEMGVLSCAGTAEGAGLMAMAYSINFLMYFFLGALSSSCRPSQSIYIIIPWQIRTITQAGSHITTCPKRMRSSCLHPATSATTPSRPLTHASATSNSIILNSFLRSFSRDTSLDHLLPIRRGPICLQTSKLFHPTSQCPWMSATAHPR